MKRFLIPVLLSAIALTTFTECSKGPSFIPNEGTIIVLNGQGIKDTIAYKCDFCDSLVNDTSLFNTIVRTATEDAKNTLKFPRTFVPERLELEVSKIDGIELVTTNEILDSVIHFRVKSFFYGKTPMGLEVDSDSESEYYSKNNKIIEIKNDIKLDSLAFNGDLINRGLFLYNDGADFINIIPTDDGGLIVASSINCVDKESGLHIMLENGEVVRHYSWNDFNCDARSYYWGFDINDLALLEKYKIELIRFSSNNNSISFSPPNNEKDYFMQFAKLILK